MKRVKARHDSLWTELRTRLIATAPTVGLKRELAETLEVTLPVIYQYVSGRSQPSAETTLRLLQWVEAKEAQQQETPGSVSSTAKGRKTRKLKSTNEKSKRVQKRV